LSADRQVPPITLVPIGQVEEAILPVIGEGLKEAFGRLWVLAAPLPHPDYAYDWRRGQYLADAILARLRTLDLPAERWLGIVDVDLYTPGLNFVFGQASVGGPAAVIALPRLRQGFYGRPEHTALFHQRVVKEAVHELGHTYGLGHCHDAACVMHFSNSLLDTDRKGDRFCPRCKGEIRRGLPSGS